jgi:hypothetical protein
LRPSQKSALPVLNAGKAHSEGDPVKTLTKDDQGLLDLSGVAAKEGTMRAIVQDTYGSPDVLELAEVSKPVLKNNQVLVRIHATSSTSVMPSS